MNQLTKDLSFYGAMSVSYIVRKYKYSASYALGILCTMAKDNPLVKFDKTNRRIVFKKPYELKRELEGRWNGVTVMTINEELERREDGRR